jgi:N-ethylmaleimide reductase
MHATLPFTKYKLGDIILQNRLVMAPMTRGRAIDNIPNELMAEYYSQRASSGLIITEATAVSPNALGYARIPGIYSREQVEGWKKVTQAVHRKGGKIFVQLVHCGRIAHPLNMPANGKVVAPSAVPAKGEIWTDQEGKQPFPMPLSLDEQALAQTIQEFVQAARHAMEAGFDGVELHAANGYLLEQFIAPNCNLRNDAYGGSVHNRCRFVLETARAVTEAIGKQKVGIRLSPYSLTNDIHSYAETEETYIYLAENLQKLDIVYLHLVDNSTMGSPEISYSLKKTIRQKFRNTLVLSGGYDIQRAEEELGSGLANLVAFGRPFISNPDLKERLQHNWPLEASDQRTYYTGERQGYTDYPAYRNQAVPVPA